ncbi:MAG: hypothetical protein ABI758_00995 [Candidatus Woesebacteria bacterium]
MLQPIQSEPQKKDTIHVVEDAIVSKLKKEFALIQQANSAGTLSREQFTRIYELIDEAHLHPKTEYSRYDTYEITHLWSEIRDIGRDKGFLVKPYQSDSEPQKKRSYTGFIELLKKYSEFLGMRR